MDKFFQALAALLPTGFAWPRDAGSTLMRVIRAIAGAFSEHHDFTTEAVRQWQPATTVNRLAEWEEATGLPDPCFAPPLELLLAGRYPVDAGRIASTTRGTTATYTDDAGVLRTAPVNTSRYEGGQLVVEAAATNQLARSADWAASEWTKFDATLPGAASNLLPNNMELSANGGGWTAGVNTSRVGATLGPTGLLDAVIYSTASVGNAFLRPTAGITYLNTNRYKLAIWAKLVTGSAPATGNIAIAETDFDNSASAVERVLLPLSGAGLDGAWRRFFMEFTTGSQATAVGDQLYIGTDWGNGAQIAFAQPVLVSTQGLSDFANITLNDPAVLAPDGSNTAMRVVTANGGLMARQATTLFLNGSSYTPSIWLYYPSGPGRVINVNDDVATVSLAISASPNWQRYKLPLWAKGAGGAFFDVETIVLSQPLWLWGPQAEPGTEMTSTIISGATAGARSADQIYLFPTEAATRDLRCKLLLSRLRGPVLAYDNSSPASLGAIVAICTGLGYVATVAYNTPFRCGVNRVGERLGALDGKLYVTVTLQSKFFRVGTSRVGERLLEGQLNGGELACYLQRVIPARFQLNMIFI